MRYILETIKDYQARISTIHDNQASIAREICEIGEYKSYNMRFSSIIRHYQVGQFARWARINHAT